jgi:hypothetical protein
MRKTYTHFEQVPVEVAEKILEQENSAAKLAGKSTRVVKKLRRAPSGPQTLPGKLEVLVP